MTDDPTDLIAQPLLESHHVDGLEGFDCRSLQLSIYESLRLEVNPMAKSERRTEKVEGTNC